MDEQNDERDFIIPGQESTAWSEWVTRHNKAYWYVKCPGCGEVHGRMETCWWDEEEGKPVIHHCFICSKQGLHYRIDPSPPFHIMLIEQYRKPVASTQLHDDDYYANMFT